jgi:hypothetical protein
MKNERHSTVRLNEFDKNEWWDVCRKMQPDLSRAQFDAMWADFCRSKAARERQGSLH